MNDLQTQVRPIRSDAEYHLALEELRGIFDQPKGSPAFDRAEVLEILIEDYEDKHFHIEVPDPIEAIKYSMEEIGMNQTELGQIIGDKAKASLVLNRKRKLSVSMIRRLHEHMKIPLEILIKEYRLVTE
ncbi:transcriptional regulator [uncultured Imperialibacter sp.]|uniref:helix-turn-helix domain-containing protein n=1 Tax=uncultured Imperialibacter sp. TaxID=1672639 RepID=UPI0030DBCC04|tara:strand:- start:41025 stop:41411 length:387 start_codon:yes stop_codon:yes gene_type:complete